MLDKWLYWDSHKAQQLAWVLAIALVLQVLYVLVIALAASGRTRTEPGVFILINGALTIVKIAIVLALMRALKRNNIIACFIIIVMAVAGIVYLALNLEPDALVRYLDLETLQYATNVVSLVLALLAIIVSILAIREIKAIKSKPEEERISWKTSA